MSPKRTDPYLDAVLNSVLNSYPLVPTPRGFRQRVMAQVSREAAASAGAGGRLRLAQVKYRLGIIDFLLAALLAFLLSVPFALLLWGLSSLDPLALPRLRLALLTFVQALYASAWLLPAVFGAALLGLLLTAALVAAALLPGQVEWQGVEGE